MTPGIHKKSSFEDKKEFGPPSSTFTTRSQRYCSTRRCKKRGKVKWTLKTFKSFMSKKRSWEREGSYKHLISWRTPSRRYSIPTHTTYVCSPTQFQRCKYKWTALELYFLFEVYILSNVLNCNILLCREKVSKFWHNTWIELKSYSWSEI